MCVREGGGQNGRHSGDGGRERRQRVEASGEAKARRPLQDPFAPLSSFPTAPFYKICRASGEAAVVHVSLSVTYTCRPFAAYAEESERARAKEMRRACACGKDYDGQSSPTWWCHVDTSPPP